MTHVHTGPGQVLQGQGQALNEHVYENFCSMDTIYSTFFNSKTGNSGAKTVTGWYKQYNIFWNYLRRQDPTRHVQENAQQHNGRFARTETAGHKKCLFKIFMPVFYISVTIKKNEPWQKMTSLVSPSSPRDTSDSCKQVGRRNCKNYHYFP